MSKVQTYQSAAGTRPATRTWGAWPNNTQGAVDPAERLQFNNDQREYWSERAFSAQGNRMQAPCSNGKGQACHGKRMQANMGGSNLPYAVNSAYLGTQTNLDVLGFRPDFNATLVEGQFTRGAAYQLINSQPPADSVGFEGSNELCQATCKGVKGTSSPNDKQCGYCSPAQIASRDPSRTLIRQPPNKRDNRDTFNNGNRSMTKL